MASSISLPRLVKSSLSTSNSACCQPTPTPNRTRPPESVSSVLTCLATSTGWRWGSTSTSVDRLTFLVTAAAKLNIMSASRMGICGGYIGALRVSVGWPITTWSNTANSS